MVFVVETFRMTVMVAIVFFVFFFSTGFFKIYIFILCESCSFVYIVLLLLFNPRFKKKITLSVVKK